MRLPARCTCLVALVLTFTAYADTVTPRDSVTSYVKVRKTPAQELRPVGKLFPGEEVEYLDAVPGWYKVRLDDGRMGYVSKSWTLKVISPVGPAPTGPVSPAPSGPSFTTLKAEARDATCSGTDAPEAPESYSSANVTEPLMWVHDGHMLELYCNCDFDEDKKVKFIPCGYVPHSTARNTKLIEWEHVVPASHFGEHRSCWKNAPKGKGRVTCKSVDPEFRLMEADLYNLQPAIGNLNTRRSNNNYGMPEGDVEEFGACDFKVGETEDEETIIEPPDEIKGDIARAVFYMADRYGADTIQLDEAEADMFIEWADDDPIDDWELQRSCRISKILGRKNPFVQSGN